MHFFASWADLEKRCDLDDRCDSLEQKMYSETDLVVDRHCVLGTQMFTRQMCYWWRRWMYSETDLVVDRHYVLGRVLQCVL